ILSPTNDLQADDVVRLLRQRGANCFRFDSAVFPSQAEYSLSYEATGRAQYILRAGGQTIDLSRLGSVWYSFPTMPVPHLHTAEAHREYVLKESLSFLYDAWHAADCLWVPAQHFVIQRAQLKATQLSVAGALGLELPPTLFTNSPDDFLEFYRRHNGQVVSKVAGFAMGRNGHESFGRYTEVVSKRDVGYAQAVRYCPLIFQAYVPKRLELRITVVGRKVFPAEIRSQEANHTRHDWRRYDHLKTRYHVHDLPTEIGQRCVELVERLGLCYGAIDMILTPDGRYVFLEINPQGVYHWIECFTGLPISEAICDLLLSEVPPTNRPGISSPHTSEDCRDGLPAGNAC